MSPLGMSAERRHKELMQQPAAKKLLEKAKAPLDLTQDGVLTAERIETFCSEACGFRFLYAMERVDRETLQLLEQLADEMGLVDKMTQLQSGRIMNYIEGYPSERRAVLHTALRDFSNDTGKSPLAEEAREDSWIELDKLRSFIDQVDGQQKFRQLLVIAIGGSELGPKAHYLALESHWKAGREVYFVDNIDPDGVASVLSLLKLPETLVLVISKSGTTLETCANEAWLRARFSEEGLDPKEHFVAITCPATPMDDGEKYSERFYLWEWIGGRFSTSSMVGGVLISFACGFEVYWQLLKGAFAMDQMAVLPGLHRNLPLLSSLLTVWNHNFLGASSQALIPYSFALRRYAAHIQQVEMESNGKSIDQLGRPLQHLSCPIIWGEPGTNGQHSFFQLLHQGTEKVHLNFVGFAESSLGEDFTWEGTTQQQKLLANMFAQALSLAKGKASENPNRHFSGNRPSNLLISSKLTPYQLGALLAYFEHKVAFQSFLWGVNGFDQEGVQLGKLLANQFLSALQERQSCLSSDRVADPVQGALLDQLDRLNVSL